MKKMNKDVAILKTYYTSQLIILLYKSVDNSIIQSVYSKGMKQCMNSSVLSDILMPVVLHSCCYL